MTTQVPTRFGDDDLAKLDELIAEGVAQSRSDAVRLAVAELYERHRRRRIGAAIAASYEAHPQSVEDDSLAMANALALTEAEPW